jgi:hypothetical protein
MTSFEVWGIEFRQYDHLYAVSACGKVLREGYPYSPRDYRADGYLSVGRQRLLHRMIAICWVPNPSNAKHVHHKDGDKTNNRADNLEWATPKEHMAHHPKIPYKRTPETIAKFIASRTGIKWSEEAKARHAVLLDTYRPRTKCKFQGTEYPSVAAGARAAGIDKSTFRVRCLSKNFPEYEIISKYYG